MPSNAKISRRRGEVAIGYRLKAQSGDAASSYGVVVNPEKSGQLTLTADDRVIAGAALSVLVLLLLVRLELRANRCQPSCGNVCVPASALIAEGAHVIEVIA